MALGHVRFMDGDKLFAESELEFSSTVLGRSQDSGIVLNHISIARRHARLTIDSGQLYIEDLGSASGTFVDGQRIPPNTSRLLEGTTDVRLGDLTFAYEPPPVVAVFSDTPAAEDITPVSAALVRVELSGPEQPIVAGESTTIIATLENRGRVVDEYQLSVEGVPDSWIILRNTQVKLLPAQEQEVAIVIQPPRSSDAASGDYNLTLSVTSEENEQVVQENAQFSIAPFEATTLEVLPRRGKKKFRLSARNQGNVAVSYALSGTDDEEAYSYDYAQPDLSLEPGASKEIPVTVRRRERQWFGRAATIMFRAKVTPTGATETTPEAATGQIDFQPPLEKFKRPVGLIVLLAIVAAAFLIYRANTGGDSTPANPLDTPTAEASPAVSALDPESVALCASPVAARPATYTEPLPLAAEDDFVGFAQNDPRWGSLEYASAQTSPLFDIGCGTTIASCGCATASLATVAALFDVMVLPSGEELNPKTLNDWFREGATLTSGGWVSRGYVFGNIQWELINTLSAKVHEEDPSVPRLEFVGRGSGSDEEIRRELAAGNPVILRVPGHFIVATKIVGDTIQIHDPYYADRTTLDAYAGKVQGSRLVRRVEDGENTQVVVVTVPNTFRVRIQEKGQDSRAIGTLDSVPIESLKDQIENTLPGATLEVEDAWRDPTCEFKAPQPGQGVIRIRLPGDRDYDLEVVDPSGGTPSWALHVYDRDGNLVDVVAGEGAVTIPALEGGSPTPTATDDSPAVTGTVVPTATLAVIATRTPTPTPSSTLTPTPTATETPTPTLTPTAAPTPIPKVTLRILPVDGGTYKCNETVTVRWTATSSVTGSYVLTILGPDQGIRFEETKSLANISGGSVILELIRLGEVGTWTANITTSSQLSAIAFFLVDAPCPVPTPF